MDVYCGLCGEPYDVFYVNQEMNQNEDGPRPDGTTIGTFGRRTILPAEAFKAGKGCPACKWGKNAPAERPYNAEASAALMELCGDDLDGVAGMLEDFGL